MDRTSQQTEPESPHGLGSLALSHPAVVAVTRTAPQHADEPERPLAWLRLRCLLRALPRRAPAPVSP